jgi:hypothetical protein
LSSSLETRWKGGVAHVFLLVMPVVSLLCAFFLFCFVEVATGRRKDVLRELAAPMMVTAIVTRRPETNIVQGRRDRKREIETGERGRERTRERWG